MLNIDQLIQAASSKANEIATTVASKAAEKAAIAEKEAHRAEAIARVEFRSLVEQAGPQKADLLEKDNKLEATIDRLVGKMNTSHDRCGRLVHDILTIQKWVDEANIYKQKLGTSINASAYEIVTARISVSAFKSIEKTPKEVVARLWEQAYAVPEIAVLISTKQSLTEKVDRILNIRLQKEESLFLEGKYFQKQVKSLEALDVTINVTDPEVSMMLQELPVYGAWRFDFSRNHTIFTRKVKAIKDNLAALKRAKKSAEKVIVEKAVAKEEAFYKDALQSNIVSLADAKELKALKEIAAKRGNSKVLTPKTIEAAKKAL